MRMAPELAYFTRPAHWGMNDRQRREAMRAYYASIAFLDDQVGRVLGALGKFGLTQNTTIVFWSDHGYQLGEHGQWMKQTLFEAAARVPMIIASPYARPHFVSHKTHDHTSITRLIEVLHDLPAMTGRDANADALLDMFDFNCPTMMEAPVAPASGKGGCP